MNAIFFKPAAILSLMVDGGVAQTHENASALTPDRESSLVAGYVQS